MISQSGNSRQQPQQEPLQKRKKEKRMTQEWKPNKKWNPFNSYKNLAHVERWSKIVKGGKIPAPVTVTIDPTNLCNLACQWCNAKTVREGGGVISLKVLAEIVKFISEWGVKAVCIAGGGEPTLHPHFGELVAMLQAENIRIGVVTNGTNLDRWQQYLMFCDWVGISIDAGTHETYAKYKGAEQFDNVLRQAKRLIDMARGLNRPLAKPGLGNGVFYKFLVTPNNLFEMEVAAEIAKEHGFKGIHYRPVGTDWTVDKQPIFSDAQASKFNYYLGNAYRFDDKNFSVYGVQHKFDKNLSPSHNFEKCRAVFMTCVFMPPSEADMGFDVGLCCDRRGDAMTELFTNGDIRALKYHWGSVGHWDIADMIKPCEDCPRCTYAPHNEIFEQVIEQDNMTHDFE